MKKLLIILGILAVLGIAAVIYVSMHLGEIVTAGVNKYGPQLTQTRLTLQSAKISPFKNSLLNVAARSSLRYSSGA